MKITFRQTGGFAGLTKSVQLDTDQLPAEDAQRLQALVEQTQFWQRPEPAQRPQPDQEQYAIGVEAKGRSRQMHLGRASMPPDLKPLVDYLAKQATYEKRR